MFKVRMHFYLLALETLVYHLVLHFISQITIRSFTELFCCSFVFEQNWHFQVMCTEPDNLLVRTIY